MTQRACDVCALVDGDHAPKAVGYCNLCGAWLCARCRSSPARRVRAAMMRGLGLDNAEKVEQNEHK